MLTHQLVLGTAIITASVVFHVSGLLALARVLRSLGAPSGAAPRRPQILLMLIVMVLGIIAVHTVEAWVWALVYLSLGEFVELAPALYFSVTTSTTLGYGDITLSEQWQLLATFEAMGGLILFGASTAFLLGFMSRLFDPPDQGTHH